MLILASESPRRREILKQAGIQFEVREASVDESMLPGESPAGHVRRLAQAKAEAVIPGPSDVVLGADTVVVLDDLVFGKPEGPEDAARMLRRLSGRWHEVITGICLRSARRVLVETETTRVRFIRVPEAEIRACAESGEPLDKAGAYAIQGLASKFIDRIEGCYFNVVGLPVSRVYQALAAWSGADDFAAR
ncbi:MAG: septum formation inhibitor Maf [Acidobacteria bacterium]|nr:septum formation inhibitor Maf [Acidobacteriota bacterium]